MTSGNQISLEEGLARYAADRQHLTEAYVTKLAANIAKIAYEADREALSIDLTALFPDAEMGSVIEQAEQAALEDVKRWPDLIEFMRATPHWEEGVRDYPDKDAAHAAVSAALPQAEKAWKALRFTADNLEEAVLADYLSVKGKVVLAEELNIVEDGEMRVIHMNPPHPVRILPFANIQEIWTDLYRWMDENVIDPVYTVRLVEPHPEIPADAHPFVYGLTRKVGGETEPAHFMMAMPDMDSLYADDYADDITHRVPKG